MSNIIRRTAILLVFILCLSVAAPTNALAADKVETPVLSEFTFYGSMRIVANCSTAGAEMYYTKDGSDPTISSSKYSSSGWNFGISVTGPTTVKVIAVKEGMENSDIAVYNFVPTAGAPVSSYSAGAWPSAIQVSLTSATPGAAIFFTTDGSDPTNLSNVYSAPIEVNDTYTVSSSITIKAIAYADGYKPSAIVSYNYYIDSAMPQLTDAASIPALVAYMSLSEKAALLCGDSGGIAAKGAAGGTSDDLKKYGIPPTSLADGPAGARLTALATQFPNGSMRASTWNTEMGEKIGQAIGEELYYLGVDLWLAPGMNIHRWPLNGRNFEYYSEDPVLTGNYGASEVNGVQSEGSGVTIKHYAANNQENGRSNLPTNISKRALREIYLKGFEIVIEGADPRAIMTSYNQINGVSTAQDKDLMKTVTRNEFGFNGIFMTDWSGTGNASYWADSPSADASAVRSGMNLIEPSGNAQNIVNAYNSGFLTMPEIDSAVTKVLEYILQSPAFGGVVAHDKLTDEMAANHLQVAYDAAVEGMTILENKNVGGKPVLPLSGSVLTLGTGSVNLIRGGTGSGAVNIDMTKIVTLPVALANEGLTVVAGTDKGWPEVDSVPGSGGMWGTSARKEMAPTSDQLAAEISNVNTVVMTLSRSSGEGSDVQKIKGAYYLSDAERNLIDMASQICRSQNKPFIVVLNMGGPIEVESWKDKADAILMTWETGSASATPIAAVLTGRENPSGKLSTTFPIDVTGTDANGRSLVSATNVGDSKGTTYTEGIYVGYRYYDTFNVPVSYEFGYGKNYSTFDYSNLVLSSDTYDGTGTLDATVDIKNTSAVAGKEVVQLYVGAPGIALDKPVKELKAFAKTQKLAADQTQTLSFSLNAENLASFDEARNAWVVEPGEYEVYAAASSKDVRLTAKFTVPNEIVVQTVADVLSPRVAINEMKSSTQLEYAMKKAQAELDKGIFTKASAGGLQTLIAQAQAAINANQYDSFSGLTAGLLDYTAHSLVLMNQVKIAALSSTNDTAVFRVSVSNLDSANAMQFRLSLAEAADKANFKITSVTKLYDSDNSVFESNYENGYEAKIVLGDVEGFEPAVSQDIADITVKLNSESESDRVKVFLDGLSMYIGTEDHTSHEVYSAIVGTNPVTACLVSEVPGDVNNSGEIDLGDLSDALTYFGKSESDSDWFDGAFRADVFRDGKIDIVDLTIIAKLIVDLPPIKE